MVRCKFLKSHSALQVDSFALGIQCPDFPVYAYTGNTDEGFYNNDCYDDGDFNDGYNDQTYGDNYGYAS